MNLKTILFIICSLFTGRSVLAQLKATPVCPPFAVDVMSGTVNNIQPKSAIVEIQTTFPCSTEMIEKDGNGICAGVFYKDKDIYFYTDRQYIEIGEKFKGKLTPHLIGISRSSLFSLLGYPKLKDANWDAFQMGYGTLILYYNKAGKIIKLQISNKSTDAIKLCE